MVKQFVLAFDHTLGCIFADNMQKWTIKLLHTSDIQYNTRGMQNVIGVSLSEQFSSLLTLPAMMYNM